MSVLRFDEVTLERALSQLSIKQSSAFAAACAGRLAHDVAHLQAGSQSDRLLAEAQKLLWAAIESGVLIEAPALEDALLRAMPDEDEDSNFEAAVIEDACSAAMYTIRSLRSDSSQNAAWSARRAYETADRYASSLLNESEYSRTAESKILEHRLVQLELQRQARDYEIAKTTNSTVVHALKAIIENERVLQCDGA